MLCNLQFSYLPYGDNIGLEENDLESSLVVTFSDHDIPVLFLIWQCGYQCWPFARVGNLERSQSCASGCGTCSW